MRRPGNVEGNGVRDDSGSGIVEFVVLAAVLLIPALYLVLTLGVVQASVFATHGLARDVARVHSTYADSEQAAYIADTFVEYGMEDYALSDRPAVTVRCSHDPCASPGGIVTASVYVPVSIPGLGAVGLGAAPISITAEHSSQVDQFWDGDPQ